MSRLVVAPLVEGHGEVEAVPILLRRIWFEMVRGESIEILHPIRFKRTKLVRPDQPRARIDRPEFDRLMQLAALKLASRAAAHAGQMALLLVDADHDCPAELAPQCVPLNPAVDLAVVVANVEYETWLVAAAPALTAFLKYHSNDDVRDPEAARCGKPWVAKRLRVGRYAETVDQAKLTARMDLALCRSRSPSFDKLCRELERRARQ
ncbi:MAG: DUF4276 family protein [Phycisphaerae bacterium]